MFADLWGQGCCASFSRCCRVSLAMPCGFNSTVVPILLQHIKSNDHLLQFCHNPFMLTNSAMLKEETKCRYRVTASAKVFLSFSELKVTCFDVRHKGFVPSMAYSSDNYIIGLLSCLSCGVKVVVLPFPAAAVYRWRVH